MTTYPTNLQRNLLKVSFSTLTKLAALEVGEFPKIIILINLASKAQSWRSLFARNATAKIKTNNLLVKNHALYQLCQYN